MYYYYMVKQSENTSTNSPSKPDADNKRKRVGNELVNDVSKFG